MDSFASHGSNDPSWANSIQSPLLRLKSEIQNLTSEDDSIITSSESDQSAAGFLQETPGPDRHNSTIIPPPSTAKAAPKSKGKEPELLRNVLKHNLYNASADGFTMKNVSPLKFKPKTPVPKQYNPYLSSGSDSSNWSGVVDLRDPNVLSPKKGHHSSKASSSRHPKTPAKDDSDDDSFDGLPKGMSPPVLMSPARPPRSSAELGLHRIGQSPSKQAVSRIVNDTMRDVQVNSAYKSRSYYGSGFVESSMSTIESPPSMSKYQGDETSQSYVDSTIDSMMRRVGLDVPQRSGLNSTPGLKVRSKGRDSLGRGRAQHSAADSSADDSFPAIDLNQGNQLFTPGYDYRGQDMDSDSDSLEDEINNTAHPSAAFLMASQGRPGDDSFGSSNHSSDSLDEDVDVGALGVVPVHPFGGSTVEDDGLDSDDSFDYQGSDVQEETVFGVPPAQRLRAAQAAQRQHDLRLHGEGLLDDTIGVQIVAGNMGVEESPTPAGWGGDELRY
jgi:DASH complex subunit ASK1